jgi:hypothetical protein
MDLGEAQGRPERLGDLTCAAGVDGVAVVVISGGAFEQQVPLSWLALPHDAVLYGKGATAPARRALGRGPRARRVLTGSPFRARRSHHYRRGHPGLD